MKAYIINIGDEILIGQTINTNAAWIGEKLTIAGFDVNGILTVHDRREDILKALVTAESESDVILITGGLGPTTDDITKQTLCEYFDTHLVTDYEVLAMISAMMERRGIPMNDKNRKQAEVPDKCRVFTNIRGTAPGMLFEKRKKLYVSMPGIPYEMEYIMTEHVLPYCKNHLRLPAIIHRNIMTYGFPEAKLAERLSSFENELPANIGIAYLPNHGVIKLRLTARGNNAKEQEALLEEQVKKLYNIIPDLIYGINEEPLEKAIGKLLLEKNQKLCTAESCTGGMIASMLTSVPGSSDYYMGSVIAYYNQIKKEILGVPFELIEKYGAVSEEVVRLMAEAGRKLLKSGYCIATSGIAGPAGGTEEKPAGTVWLAVSSSKKTVSEIHQFGYERNTNIRRFSNAALGLLWNVIKES